MDTFEDDDDNMTKVVFVPPHPRLVQRKKPLKHVEPRLPLPAPVRGRPAPRALQFRGKRPGTTPGIDYDRTPAVQRIDRDRDGSMDDDITKRIAIT